MATKTVRCNFCGAQTTIPSNLRPSTVRCPQCGSAAALAASKDPLAAAQNVVNCAANAISRAIGSYSSGGFGRGASSAAAGGWGRKKAVLCGVSYYGQSHRLQGTVNDVNCMKYFLVRMNGFPPDSIVLLTEEESHPSLVPTKNNIRQALQWLVQDCRPGDSLVFHFSGHGSQRRDYYNRDEIDGRDEMLWPVDHQTAGMILDDEINATIVRPLPRGVKLHAVIDACHSATLLDLPYLCRLKRSGFYTWEDHGRRSATYKGTSGGLAVCISACGDQQISIDTTALSRNNTSTGALTYSFIQAAQSEPGITYGRLLNSMNETVRNVKSRSDLTNGPISSLLRNVIHRVSAEARELPQLSSSEKFEIYSRQFAL